jgi:hypothetical protein
MKNFKMCTTLYIVNFLKIKRHRLLERRAGFVKVNTHIEYSPPHIKYE